jgi:hypothetical protein
MLDAHKHKQQPILVRLIKVLGDSWLPIQPPFPQSGGFFPLPALRKLQSAQRRWGQLRAYRPTRTAFRSPQRLLAGASLEAVTRERTKAQECTLAWLVNSVDRIPRGVHFLYRLCEHH